MRPRPFYDRILALSNTLYSNHVTDVAHHVTYITDTYKRDNSEMTP